MEISSVQVFLVFLRCFLIAIIPFAVFFYMRKRYGGRMYPMLVGILTTMLIILPRALLRAIIVPNTESITYKWIVTWVIGASCEELGRYITMKYAMPNHDTFADALCYGIGHGGMEVLANARIQIGFFLEALGIIGTESNLAVFSEQSIVDLFVNLLSCADNLAFHMAMSVLIARAVHYVDCKKLIPIAIFLHVLTNFTMFAFGIVAGLLLTGVIWATVYLHGKQYSGGTL